MLFERCMSLLLYSWLQPHPIRKKNMSAAVRQHAQSLVKDFTDSPSENKQAPSGEPEEVNRCLVFCRVRPSIPRDYEDGAFQLVSVDKKRVVVKDERHYDFDGTFDQKCRQEDIFNQVAVPCLTHAFKGFCSALMCYGQTGTGKSFTMCCTKSGSEGIIPRAAKYIYETIAKETSRRYHVQGQFVQIYRDQLGDLMSDSGRDKVDIRFEVNEGVTLTGCSSHDLTSEAEFMKFYNDGNVRRVVTATAMNPESSRGHTAMVIWIASEPADDDCGGKYRGKITFIDLAGYERFSKTGISNSNAIMKDEAKTINASLLSLGHVVTSLSNGDKHIPWRNAKLTRILQDSIGGRSRTSIILTVGPSSDHLHETSNSLQFGLRAMAVKVEAKVSVTVDYEKLAAKLQSMLNERNEKINLLELQLASRDAERAELMERHHRDDENLHTRYEAELGKLIAEGAAEDQIQKLKDVYKAELENLKEQQREEFVYQEEAYAKEMGNLVEEQKRQEQRRQVEMKLAQERLIEEFQAKLESARGGTNEDLIKAIQQLSEKDAVLASRANDTARLHEHIEALTQQIRDMGAQPLHEAKFPETFLDISQIGELQAKLEGELERQHLKVVELRTQLERMTLVCNERLDELEVTKLEKEKLHDELRKAGLTVEATALELEQMEQHRAKMVDPMELETVRVNLQADIDELKSHNDELQKEVAKLTEQLKEQQAAVPLTGRVRGLSITGRHRPTILPQRDEGPKGDLLQTYREQIAELQRTVASGEQERNTLCQRIADLENRLAEGGLEVDDAEDYLPAPPNRDMEVILAAKDAEVEALMTLVTKYEQNLASERSAKALMESHNQALCEQLRQLGHDPVDCSACHAVAPAAPIAMDVFQEVLHKVRESSVKIAKRLAARSFDEEPDEHNLNDLIQEKEEELQMRDEIVLMKSNECNALVRSVDRLEKQLVSLGVNPVCHLSDDHRNALAAELEEMDEIKGRQQVLEEDRKKLQVVLETLKADRAVNTMDRIKMEEELQETKRKAKELEDLRIEQAEREQFLQEQTRLATRQMMDAQAKMAAAESRSGVLSRFKKLFA